MSKETQIINSLISTARKAQNVINEYSQQQIDELVLAIAWAIINPKTNEYLSSMAVDSTGLGNIENKIIKNKRKTLGLLRDLQGVKTVGVIHKDSAKGIVEIARPVGVIGAIVPSTNPIATPLNKILNAIKCRNAIIISPSPKGQNVCSELVALVHKAIVKVGSPSDIVQMLPIPASKELTNELTKQVDLVVATGSQSNILRAQQHGTPTIGVGVGNVPSIIDNSADIVDAVDKIIASKTFDNATSCSSENSLVIVDEVYDEVIRVFADNSCPLLDANEKQQLENVMWNEKKSLNPQIIAQSAHDIAHIAGFTDDRLKNAQILLVDETGFGNEYPFSGEKLSPVLTIYRARDFTNAVEITNSILSYQGKGHSCSIHSRDENNIMHLGKTIPVCRVIVNQAHCFATGGNFDNGLPFSLSMGCGTWGKNVIDTSIHYRQYLNITKISTTIASNEPSLEDVFGEYWSKYGEV